MRFAARGKYSLPISSRRKAPASTARQVKLSSCKTSCQQLKQIIVASPFSFGKFMYAILCTHCTLLPIVHYVSTVYSTCLINLIKYAYNEMSHGTT